MAVVLLLLLYPKPTIIPLFIWLEPDIEWTASLLLLAGTANAPISPVNCRPNISTQGLPSGRNNDASITLPLTGRASPPATSTHNALSSVSPVADAPRKYNVADSPQFD